MFLSRNSAWVTRRDALGLSEMGQDMGSAISPPHLTPLVLHSLLLGHDHTEFAMAEPLVTTFSVTHLQSSVAHDYPNESVVSSIKVITIIYQTAIKAGRITPRNPQMDSHQRSHARSDLPLVKSRPLVALGLPRFEPCYFLNIALSSFSPSSTSHCH